MNTPTETDCAEVELIEAVTESASKKETIVDQSTNEGSFFWAWDKMCAGFTTSLGEEEFYIENGKLFRDWICIGRSLEASEFFLDEITSNNWQIDER